MTYFHTPSKLISGLGTAQRKSDKRGLSSKQIVYSHYHNTAFLSKFTNPKNSPLYKPSIKRVLQVQRAKKQQVYFQ